MGTIVDSHPELTTYHETILDAVENPDYILVSRRGALAAVVVLGRKASVFYVEKGDMTDSLFLPVGKSKALTFV